MSQALKLALSPPLLAQALHARRAIPKLPEAAGQRRGSVGHGAAALRLLIVGDSSAAGVGVEHQDQALAGRLSHALAHTLSQRVQWQLCARSGINSLQASGLLDDAEAADVAVEVTGVNDVVDQLVPARALAGRSQLLRSLRERCGIRHAVMTPVPPMQRFAGLPQTLRWMAGRDAAAHERAGPLPSANPAARSAQGSPVSARWRPGPRSSPASAICPSTWRWTMRVCWPATAFIRARRSISCGAMRWPPTSPPRSGRGSDPRLASGAQSFGIGLGLPWWSIAT